MKFRKTNIENILHLLFGKVYYLYLAKTWGTTFWVFLLRIDTKYCELMRFSSIK